MNHKLKYKYFSRYSIISYGLNTKENITHFENKPTHRKIKCLIKIQP